MRQCTLCVTPAISPRGMPASSFCLLAVQCILSAERTLSSRRAASWPHDLGDNSAYVVKNILGPLYALHGGTSETAGSISGLPGNPRVFCSVRLCDSGSRLPLACSCRFDFSREQYSWAPRTSIIRSLGSVRLCTSQSCASGLAARTARISSLRQTPYRGVIHAQSQQFCVPCLFPWDIGRQADPNAPS